MDDDRRITPSATTMAGWWIRPYSYSNKASVLSILLILPRHCLTFITDHPRISLPRTFTVHFGMSSPPSPNSRGTMMQQQRRQLRPRPSKNPDPQATSSDNKAEGILSSGAVIIETRPRPKSSSPEYPKDEVHVEADLPLLEDWLHHDDESFHHFTDTEVQQIRTRLLKWYYENRRKLPWRGDPPPWNGSTAGIAVSLSSTATTLSKKKRNVNESSAKQPTLDGFFTSKKPRNGTVPPSLPKDEPVIEDTVDSLKTSDSTTLSAFPVTGYGVWVSEIMLQQTRVEAVIPYWVKWMQSFPTISDLARASDEQVNSHWAGLGFYRRARLLHQASKLVVDQYNGTLPTTVEELLTLPGIGRYTAHAIASIVFQQQVPVVDGNVCRVLSRLKGIAQSVKSPVLKDKYGWILAEQLVVGSSQNDPNGQFNAGDLNQALMELGATYCAPSGTGIDPNDPLRDLYWSTQLGHQLLLRRHCSRDREDSTSSHRTGKTCRICEPGGVEQVVYTIMQGLEGLGDVPCLAPDVIDRAKVCGHQAFPLAPVKVAKREEVLAMAAISRPSHDDSGELLWLMVRRPDSGLLAGQWEFPSALVWSSDEEESRLISDNDPSQGTSKKQRSKKRKDMSDQVPKIAASVRKRAVQSLLENLVCTTDDDSDTLLSSVPLVQRTSIHPADSPMEHVFSHIRHTMYVEYGHIRVPKSSQTFQETALEWIDAQGRQVRWLSTSDMASIGVTSGVKKVLNAVTTSSHFHSTKKRK